MANYKPVADKYANQYGIPRGLFRELVKWESGWDQNAGSPAGALGFTQLMPGTASGMGINPHDPAQNLLGGARYLREQHDAFAGLAKKIGVNPWALALAAYNAGPNAVRKYGGIPPYAETQKYVKGILAAAGHFTTMPGAAPSSTSTPQTSANVEPAAAAAPDFSSVAFDNLSHISSGSFSPSESLSALTQAVAAQPPPVSTPAPQSAPAAPSSPSGDHAAQHPTGNVKWEGVSLAGVRPSFLNKVAAAAEASGATQIRVISGYRSPDHNRSVHGATRSNHMTGDAIDAEAFVPGHGWIPLGVLLLAAAQHYGLRSGDVPGFFNGSPDPNHVDDGANQRH